MPGKLRNYGAGRYLFWCQGCNSPHAVAVSVPGAYNWTFNGDFDKPTFEPSIRISVRTKEGGDKTLCHCFVRNGNIEFCSDSPHALAGQTVPLQDPPDWVGSKEE